MTERTLRSELFGPPAVASAFEPRATQVLSTDDARALADALISRSWSPLEQHVADHVHRRVEVQQLPVDEFGALTGHLREVMLSVNDLHYRFDVTGSRRSDAPHGVRYTSEHGHYDWHVDAGSAWPTRKLSLVLFLSDPGDYAGGALEVSGAGSIEPPPPGIGVMFPSFMPHRVTKVTAGERLVVVGWMHGPTFR